MVALSLSIDPAPPSARANAARMASVPKMVLNALIFCSSLRPLVAFSRMPAISAMLFICPLASKKALVPSRVRRPRLRIMFFAGSPSGTSRCKKVLNEVPASLPLANRGAMSAMAALKSSKETPTDAATPPAWLIASR